MSFPYEKLNLLFSPFTTSHFRTPGEDMKILDKMVSVVGANSLVGSAPTYSVVVLTGVPSSSPASWTFPDPVPLSLSNFVSYQLSTVIIKAKMPKAKILNF